MVLRTGFEPVNVALRGQCVRPLHQRSRECYLYNFRFANKGSITSFLAGPIPTQVGV